jgi:nitrate/TMAO reductase-like tetraheme cytochrome c subunit
MSSDPEPGPEPSPEERISRRDVKLRRRRQARRIAIVLAILVVVFAGASLAAAAYTERSVFCETACHEMAPYGATWEKSAHHDVACVRCHIKPGALEFVEAKGSALREVYVHFTGQVKAPIAVTEHIPDSTCTASDCHPSGSVKDPLVLKSTSAASATPAASPSASAAPPVTFSHKQHDNGTLCIDCHARVVHTHVPGKPYVDPATMAFCLRCHDGKQASGACQTCHKAPHADRGPCTDCHQLGSWASTFKHPVPLGPQHHKVVCEECHTKATPQQIGFPAGCVSCHAKEHKTVKQILCARCHVPTHWKPSTFEHPKTGCENCHTRPHPDRGDCLRCHTTSSWANHFQHPIALGGVHAGFPCEKCHTNGLNAPGRDCSSCHGSQHGGLTNCAQCHTTSSFVPSTFNHPGAGEHGAGSFACSACHPNGNFTSAYCSCHGGHPPSGG